MKYIIVLGDGMADEPIDRLNGQTPLEHAKTPAMDVLARKAKIGIAHTIPEGMSPGSDTANLSVLGYDPRMYYTGRSPLEALSIGVPMKETDVAIRCNVVTLSEDDVPYEDKRILDHSSGEISTQDAKILIDAVKKELQNEMFAFYAGTSYRHLLIWDQGQVVELTPPHDVLGQVIREHLPTEPLLREMMKKSYDILNHHPINEERAKRGLNKANSIWFWGAGTKPILTSFEEKTGYRGAMISAVDLLKGIAVGAGLRVIHVEGADGTLHTNYEGKALAAVKTLLEDEDDFVYVHVEAPDEMGHLGSLTHKLKAIELLDQRLISLLVKKMDESKEPYRLLILPDHPTPIRLRTHTGNPVPFLLYDSTSKVSMEQCYNEKEAARTGYIITEGHQLIDLLFERK